MAKGNLCSLEMTAELSIIKSILSLKIKIHTRNVPSIGSQQILMKDFVNDK